jgi:hypothetical protein
VYVLTWVQQYLYRLSSTCVLPEISGISELRNCILLSRPCQRSRYKAGCNCHTVYSAARSGCGTAAGCTGPTNWTDNTLEAANMVTTCWYHSSFLLALAQAPDRAGRGPGLALEEDDDWLGRRTWRATWYLFRETERLERRNEFKSTWLTPDTG